MNILAAETIIRTPKIPAQILLTARVEIDSPVAAVAHSQQFRPPRAASLRGRPFAVTRGRGPVFPGPQQFHARETGRPAQRLYTAHGRAKPVIQESAQFIG